MSKESGFSVMQRDGVTKIVNHSKHTLYIYVRPIKPKRKFTRVVLIPRDTFKIFDHQAQIDLTKISFQLEDE